MKLIKLSQRYVTALRSHLKRGRGASFQAALSLGRQAVGLGLETLELALIHQQALITLELSSQKNGVVKRAELFFTEALTPIVATHLRSKPIESQAILKSRIPPKKQASARIPTNRVPSVSVVRSHHALRVFTKRVS